MFGTVRDERTMVVPFGVGRFAGRHRDLRSRHFGAHGSHVHWLLELANMHQFTVFHAGFVLHEDKMPKC